MREPNLPIRCYYNNTILSSCQGGLRSIGRPLRCRTRITVGGGEWHHRVWKADLLACLLNDPLASLPPIRANTVVGLNALIAGRHDLKSAIYLYIRAHAP